MHVVDTDICVDALRGLPRAIDGLAALEDVGPLAVSAVTAHELWQGAFAARDTEGSAAAVARFLSAFNVLSFDQEVAHKGGWLAAKLRADGHPIGDLDTMIAATALLHGATLVTRNTRHFRRVPGLRLQAV
jgi:tRNA(fMet)-specific endonuclease VapC